MLKKVALISLALCLVASMSYAGMLFDLRIAGSPDPKAATIDHIGQVLSLEVWGMADTATGSTLLNNVSTASMRFTSVEDATNGLMGNMSDGQRSSAFTNGALGTVQQYDLNPDAEWGGPFPTLSNSAYLNDLVLSGSVATVDGQIFLGRVTWTSTIAQLGSSTLQVVPFINSSTGQQAFKYTVDGVLKTNSASNPIGVGSGAPVQLIGIPEPSTLVLLGMGALALVFIRRRK